MACVIWIRLGLVCIVGQFSLEEKFYVDIVLPLWVSTLLASLKLRLVSVEMVRILTLLTLSFGNTLMMVMNSLPFHSIAMGVSTTLPGLSSALMLGAGLFFGGTERSGRKSYWFFAIANVVASIVLILFGETMFGITLDQSLDPETRFLLRMQLVVTVVLSFVVPGGVFLIQSHRYEKQRLELEVLLRHREKFLQKFTHELRTPLAAIIGLTESLNAERERTAFPRELAGLHDCATSVLALLEDVLEWRQISSSSREANSSFSVGTMMTSIGSIVSPLLKARNIRLESVFKDDIADRVLVGDARRIQQTLLVLLQNSSKYCNEGGAVTVSFVCTPNGMLTCCVADTGVGFAGDGDRLFEEFYQEKNTLTRGVGLGLSIAKDLVQALPQGKIWATSPGIGKGALFCFETLVCVDKKEPSVPPLASTQIRHHNSAPNKGVLKVLTVEDNKVLSLVLERQLGAIAKQQRRPIEVCQCSSAIEALNRIGDSIFDVVITDICMESLSGLELVALIKMREKKDNVRRAKRIVIVSAIRLSMEELGPEVDAFLLKPTSISALTRALFDHGKYFPN